MARKVSKICITSKKLRIFISLILAFHYAISLKLISSGWAGFVLINVDLMTRGKWRCEVWGNFPYNEGLLRNIDLCSKCMRFDVLTAVTMKINISQNITLYSIVDIKRRFGGTYCFGLQVQQSFRSPLKGPCFFPFILIAIRSFWALSLDVPLSPYHIIFTLCLFFHPEDGGSEFLKNLGKQLATCLLAGSC
jgi:hypothetical protein